jgi:fructan beta-fructosidase
VQGDITKTTHFESKIEKIWGAWGPPNLVVLNASGGLEQDKHLGCAMQGNLTVRVNLALAVLSASILHLLQMFRNVISDSNGSGLHLATDRLRLRTMSCFLAIAVCPVTSLFAQSRTIHITQRYLNIPVDRASEMRLFQISVGGMLKREFPMQLAEHAIDYWIFLDVSEFKGSTITLTGSSELASPSFQPALDRIYQADRIGGAATLYKESNRPRFHFTVKRGWSNDVNGPIFYKGQYHLFWQAFPFGVKWDTDFMYWGHAVTKDLIHWRELAPALMVDKLGSPWSGTSFVDHNNDGGWGKDALVLIYTAFDRTSHKQVQCIAYSIDNGATFTRYTGNPVLDSNREVGSNDTRDPKVFWYEPGKRWVMVLFEKDGMSFYNSIDLKTWTRKSHLKGFHECPDLFELPIDGDNTRKKWILHGGSSSYVIGSFDGATFTAESRDLHYAEGKNVRGDDVLYAAQSFAEMPDGRRVQMAWGRIQLAGMPFNQMMLFPTKFKLKTTKDGLRMQATPIDEIAQLRGKARAWSALTAADANQKLDLAGLGPLDVKLQVTLGNSDSLAIQYDGNNLATIQSADFENGRGQVEVLIDKCVAEIFVDGGVRYIAREIPNCGGGHGLELSLTQKANIINQLEIYEMKSMWNSESRRCWGAFLRRRKMNRRCMSRY